MKINYPESAVEARQRSLCPLSASWISCGVIGLGGLIKNQYERLLLSFNRCNSPITGSGEVAPRFLFELSGSLSGSGASVGMDWEVPAVGGIGTDWDMAAVGVGGIGTDWAVGVGGTCSVGTDWEVTVVGGTGTDWDVAVGGGTSSD
jgi:hypothetical protein